ncbi:MAG: hypothetical protein K6E97_07245 [Treponema sp.]|nr:hypothetical protein [Treponema sp.]
MNTIPITFDEHQIKRAIIGGSSVKKDKLLNISVILLNSSGSHFKLNVFENLIGCNFDSIISIENDSKNYSIDDIARKFPQIKFIVPLEEATEGEMINLAMSEITSDYALVIKDSLYIPSGFILSNLAQRLTEEGIYCVVPRLSDKNKNGIASLYTPGAEKSHFIIDSSSIVKDGLRTVYPFDGIALYNRKKFIQLGGFDYTIRTSYWQNLDLAIRSWLWGEETKLTTMLQFSYVDEIPMEDTTFNQDYLRYYLKNELPKFKIDKAYISRSSFLRFFSKSSCGILEARRHFRFAKNWVEKNKYNFKKDLQTFISRWNVTEEDEN